MGSRLTIAVHDWDGSDEALVAARALAGHGLDARLLAVVERRDAGKARRFLHDLGFEVVTAEDGATPGARKNAAAAGAEGEDVIFLSRSAGGLKADDFRRLHGEGGAPDRGGVAGCKVVDENGMLVNAGNHVIQPECDLFAIGGRKKDINQYYYTREVEGVDSTCMLVTAEALAAAGGFDESYGKGYDDADFCLKVRAAGYRVVCVGSVRAVVPPEAVRKGGPERETGREAFREGWSARLGERYETRVMWHSWINAPTGYAVSSQYLVLALEALDVDVRYGFVYGVEEPPNEDERIMEVRRKQKDLDIAQIVYGQGDVFFKNSGRYRIGYSMLEVTGIPQDWVEQANALDEVWVPSHFNRDTFASSGVTRPIHVMPLGVDVNYFHPFISSRKIDGRFVFMSVFEWGERKAPEILLRAYNQEFSSRDDVLLLLKVINTDPGLNVERQIEAMRLQPERAPVVLVLNHNIPSYQMGSLYCSSDCFVLPTRGEGWGMPTLEAMACGLPVISTHWSAQTEFFSSEVGYPVNIKGLIPAVAKCPYYEGLEWADPDTDHLARMMRHVYENREEARATGMRASIAAREKWTWLDAAARMKKRLLEVSG